MLRRVILLVLFVAFLAADTAHFGGRCLAGMQWLRGERAQFGNDPGRAWRHDTRALSLGGDPGQIETNMAELLLMGLDQLASGFHPRLALPAEESVETAFRLVGRRISAAPFSAYSWSQASDIFVHAAARKRRAEVLDLSLLSDNPIENLLPEERLALAAQEIASRLEPNNFIYHDLLAQLWMDLGSPEEAAPHCRRSVAAAPDNRIHLYLTQRDLPGVILEAAVQGFEDASARPSMMPRAFVLGEAARLLSWHGDDRRAVGFLRSALEADPSLADARMQLADCDYRLKDYEEAVQQAVFAARLSPKDPSPHYTAGLSYLELGKLDPAIEEFRAARELGPQEIRYFLVLGQALESAGRLKEAEHQFVAAANRNPSATDAWAALIAFYARQHDPGAASAVCSRLASLKPGIRTFDDVCSTLETSQ